MANQDTPDEAERIRRELTATNRFLDAIIENIPNMVFVKEAKNLSFVRFNRAGEELLGVKREDLLGKNDFDFFPSAEAEFFQAKDRETLKNGKLIDIPEEPIETGRGQRWLHTKKVPILDEAGEPAFLLGISEDITERKLAEQKLVRWAHVFEHAEWGIVVGSADGKTLELMNPAFARMHDYTVEELVGKPIVDVFAKESRAELPAWLEEAHRLGRLTFEAKHVKRDGTLFPVLVNIAAVKDVEGKVAYRVVNVQDISVLKHAEEQMRKAKEIAEATSRELEAFSYSVSHDLRAPLRSIDGFSQAVLEDHAHHLDAEGRDHLERVRRAAQRMAQLIDDLLKLSRVTRAELARAPVDLSALAHEVIEELRRTYPGSQAEITIQPDMHVYADERLMRVLLDNLLGNAWKFSARKPLIRIELGERIDGGERVFFVRDEGAGFDMAYASKLFGAFNRLHAMTEYEGTGIGLATVQRIVHRHGGRIWAEAAVGRGATFSFTLDSGP